MVVPSLTWLSNAKNATTISVQDTTGLYNATTNPGGYGSPNAGIPTMVGFRIRTWDCRDPYGYLLISDNTLINNLINTGLALSMSNFGLTKGHFSSGVHHVKYYPLEMINVTVSLTNGSKEVQVSSGTLPNTWDVNYIGIVFGTSPAKVFNIDRTQPITSTTFYLTEPWSGSTGIETAVRIAPEADLKILVSEPANACLVSRIGQLAMNNCSCDATESDKLTRLTMWMFASKINFDCKDFKGAHNLLVSVELECHACKGRCSCS